MWQKKILHITQIILGLFFLFVCCFFQKSEFVNILKQKNKNHHNKTKEANLV